MKRVQQKRGRALPPGVRSVARPSRWGNPYRLHREEERDEVMARYRDWLDQRLAEDPAFLEPLRGAAGLACYCPLDRPCHADILIARLAAGECDG
jgi:hypothetical protein